MSHWQVLQDARIIVSNDPHTLWENAVNYFKWCDENPIKTKKLLLSGKKGGENVTIEQPRAYSIKALCIHCGITEDYLRDIRDSKDTTSLYYQVVDKILNVIWTQNFEYAMVDLFNPILTAKVLNLDRGEGSNEKPPEVKFVGGNDLPKLANSENEVLENLEYEKRFSED